MSPRPLLFILCLAVAVSLRAEDPPLLTQARAARAELIPEVAISKLRLLRKSDQLSPEVRRAVDYELSASLLAAGEIDDALTVVRPLAAAGDAPARLLQADILVHAGRSVEALSIYQKLTALPELAEAAQLGSVECWQALGQMEEATNALAKYTAAHPADLGAQLRLAGLFIDQQKLTQARQTIRAIGKGTPGDDQGKKYLQARLLLASNQAPAALTIFEEMLQNPAYLTPSLYFGATLGNSEALATLSGFETAHRVLEKYISHHGGSPFLDEAFRRLEQMYEQEDRPSDAELRKWMQKGPPRRAALAHYYAARLAWQDRKFDKADSILSHYAQNYPAGPDLYAVRLLQADVNLEMGHLPEAVRTLDEAMRAAQSEEERAQIELRTGLVYYRQHESLLAENAFRRAAQGSVVLRQNATFDAALAALDRHNYEAFYEDYRGLNNLDPAHPLRSDLVLEEGFAQARSGDPKAGDSLELFLHHFPHHPRQNEARIALAELAFQDGDRQNASQYLKVVNQSNPEPETAERAAYLAVFLAAAETPPNPARVVEAGLKFIHDFPRSAFLPEVRMKVGETYFQTGDHANAETQFTLIGQEAPASSYAETALFLAGQAAMKWLDSGAVDRALRLFDDVVKRNGPLKLYARQQQAIVQARLGRESEAVTIDDAILSAQPPPEPELRYATLCSKGDNLAALARRDPANFEAAAAVYDSLAALPDVTPVWRNQALYKKGLALEQMSRESEALAAYYDVLDRTVSDGREFFWFYKAGFDAAHLFEQHENWRAAIGIYGKMAKVEGPRSAEVKARLSQLRLEKFIWD